MAKKKVENEWWGYENPNEPYLGTIDMGSFGSIPIENPYFGMPTRPDYLAGYTDDLAMTPEVERRLSGVNMDMRGVEAFRKDALRRSASPWARLMTEKSRFEETGAKETAVRDARAATMQAEADMAGAGGLTAGARERLAKSGGRNALAMTQDVARQGVTNRMGIGIQDETNRITQLSQLPGMENQVFQNAMQKENAWTKAKDVDVQRLISENQSRNTFNQGVYGKQMEAWAANKQAKATENSGK